MDGKQTPPLTQQPGGGGGAVSQQDVQTFILIFCSFYKSGKRIARPSRLTMPLLGFNFNLGDQLAFYGSYHHNPVNQAIHFVFVPAILWTVAVWLAYTPVFCHCFLAAHLAFLPAPLPPATI